MSKFAREGAVPKTAPIQTRGRRTFGTSSLQAPTPVHDTWTHEGGRGFTRTPESELFILGASFLHGQPSFYESPGERERRFVTLVRQADQAWLREFIPYLRRTLNIRTAAVVAAAEYVRCASLGRPGYEGGRHVVRGALARADEPADIVGYWYTHYGKQLPRALRLGVRDALESLVDEYRAMKYAGWDNRVSMADVIKLTHPRPRTPEQRTLFEYLLARRHGRGRKTPTPGPGTTLRADEQAVTGGGDFERLLHPRVREHIRRYVTRKDKEYGSLTAHVAREALLRMPADQRRELVLRNPAQATTVLREAAVTHEWVAGTWLADGRGMDAAAWRAVIPLMGVGALLKNLRNFDEAGLHAMEAYSAVASVLMDEERVRKSRELPLRFLRAYDAVSRTRWAHPLEVGLRHSLSNVPRFAGKTIALADISLSMTDETKRYGCGRWREAVAFATIAADRSDEARLWVYASAHNRRPHGIEELRVGDVLPTLEKARQSGPFGGGTQTAEAVLHAYQQAPDARRIVLVTDEQAFGTNEYTWNALQRIPVPIYTWNLHGYAPAWFQSGRGDRFTVGGLSDAGFKMIAALDAGHSADWPWKESEQDAVLG